MPNGLPETREVEIETEKRKGSADTPVEVEEANTIPESPDAFNDSLNDSFLLKCTQVTEEEYELCGKIIGSSNRENEGGDGVVPKKPKMDAVAKTGFLEDLISPNTRSQSNAPNQADSSKLAETPKASTSKQSRTNTKSITRNRSGPRGITSSASVRSPFVKVLPKPKQLVFQSYSRFETGSNGSELESQSQRDTVVKAKGTCAMTIVKF